MIKTQLLALAVTIACIMIGYGAITLVTHDFGLAAIGGLIGFVGGLYLSSMMDNSSNDESHTLRL